MEPTGGACLLSSKIQHSVYVPGIVARQQIALAEFKMAVSVAVRIGYCSPNGYYARVEQRIAFAQSATVGKIGSPLFVEAY